MFSWLVRTKKGGPARWTEIFFVFLLVLLFNGGELIELDKSVELGGIFFLPIGELLDKGLCIRRRKNVGWSSTRLNEIWFELSVLHGRYSREGILFFFFNLFFLCFLSRGLNWDIKMEFIQGGCKNLFDGRWNFMDWRGRCGGKVLKYYLDSKKKFCFFTKFCIFNTELHHLSENFSIFESEKKAIRHVDFKFDEVFS